MMDDKKDVFINEALEYAMTMYLKYKYRPYSYVYNSFLVVLIRGIINIYGEEEIIDAYLNNNEVKFDNVIKRYGYRDSDLINFKSDLKEGYAWIKKCSEENKVTKSPYFISLQKSIIDMMLKKIDVENVSIEEKKDFENYFYSDIHPNPSYTIFNNLASTQKDELSFYWKKSLYNKENEITITPIKENVLPSKVYEQEGLKLESILDMSQKDIDQTNSNIFNKYNVSPEESDASSKLTELVNMLTKQEEVIKPTGFANIIVIISIIATLAMITLVVYSFLIK